MLNSYHNTNQESGETLKQSETKAQFQEKKALEIFRSYHSQWFTRFSFQREYASRHGIWLKDNVASRILSNMVDAGHLEKSDHAQFKGETGKGVHGWQLKVAGQLGFGLKVNPPMREGL